MIIYRSNISNWKNFFSRNNFPFLYKSNKLPFFFFKFLTSSLFFEEKALVGQGDDISQDGSATREEQEQESPVRAGRRSNRRIRIRIACYIVWKFLFRFNYSNSYSFLNKHMSSFDKSNFMVLNTHISILMWKLYLYRDEIKHVKFFDWQNVQIIKAII